MDGEFGYLVPGFHRKTSRDVVTETSWQQHQFFRLKLSQGIHSWATPAPPSVGEGQRKRYRAKGLPCSLVAYFSVKSAEIGKFRLRLYEEHLEPDPNPKLIPTPNLYPNAGPKLAKYMYHLGSKSAI